MYGYVCLTNYDLNTKIHYVEINGGTELDGHYAFATSEAVNKFLEENLERIGSYNYNFRFDVRECRRYAKAKVLMSKNGIMYVGG